MPQPRTGVKWRTEKSGNKPDLKHGIVGLWKLHLPLGVLFQITGKSADQVAADFEVGAIWTKTLFPDP
jgi:hypothetical protein